MAGVDYGDYDEDDPPAPRRGRAQRLIHIAGAVSSLALVIGLGVWGYKVAVRNVMGVPVIRAHEGPMRIAPEDPGGTIADHQGLAVNSIAEAGGVTAPADTITLAPRPTELSDQDGAGLADPEPRQPSRSDAVTGANAASGGAAAPTGAPIGAQAGAQTGAPTGAQVGPAPQSGADPSGDTSGDPAASGHAPVDPSAVSDAVAQALSPDAAGAVANVDTAARAAEVKAQGGLVKSHRPPPRPAKAGAQAAAKPGAGPAEKPVTTSATNPATNSASNSAAKPAQKPAQKPAGAAPAETRADAVKAGTRLVQLGAFDTEDQTRAEWARLRKLFPELLNAKSLVVQAAQTGGRSFYRLRALGFDDDDDARRFCTALVAEGAPCIPVMQR